MFFRATDYGKQHLNPNGNNVDFRLFTSYTYI